MYEYRAIVEQVVDGDTIKVKVDLGFDVWIVETLRFARINAYETKLGTKTTAKEKNLGLQGKDFLTNLLPTGTMIQIKTQKDNKEKYGRYLAEVFSNGINVNDLMVSKSFAIYTSYD